MDPVIDPASAKAAEEVAKTVGKAIDVSQQTGSFIGKVLGTAPEDAVGLLIGDWLRHKRIRNWHRLEQRTEEILRERNVLNPGEVSPSLAIPLIEAAQDESREELQDLWAKLLASAMDPKTAHLVRKTFIDLAKQMDPLDALALCEIKRSSSLWTSPSLGKGVDIVASRLGRTHTEVLVSFDHLSNLQVVFYDSLHQPRLWPRGELFLLAVGD